MQGKSLQQTEETQDLSKYKGHSAGKSFLEKEGFSTMDSVDARGKSPVSLEIPAWKAKRKVTPASRVEK